MSTLKYFTKIECPSQHAARMRVKGYCLTVSTASVWKLELRWLKLNAFAARTAIYFLINLCYESDGHVTRQAGSDRWVARFASDKHWAWTTSSLITPSGALHHMILVQHNIIILYTELLSGLSVNSWFECELMVWAWTHGLSVNSWFECELSPCPCDHSVVVASCSG